ncbi:MAG: hypothetical protein ACYSO4_07000 [Planctomycetota bacterium]
MGPWQNKILFTLFLYGAGFVTAVYFLTPCQSQQEQSNPDSNSRDWAIKIRSGIDTSIHFAEEYALRAADLIRSKMGQGNDQSG